VNKVFIKFFFSHYLQNVVDNMRKSTTRQRIDSTGTGSHPTTRWEAEDVMPKAKGFSQFKKNFSNFISMDFSSKSMDDCNDTVSVRYMIEKSY